MRHTLRPATDTDRDWLDRLRRAAHAPLFDATWGGWDEARHERLGFVETERTDSKIYLRLRMRQP